MHAGSMLPACSAPQQQLLRRTASNTPRAAPKPVAHTASSSTSRASTHVHASTSYSLAPCTQHNRRLAARSRSQALHASPARPPYVGKRAVLVGAQGSGTLGDKPSGVPDEGGKGAGEAADAELTVAGEEEGEAEEVELKELSQPEHVILEDGFRPDLVKSLRGVFDARFADPRATHAERFLWDYWYCPSAAGTCQYNLVRTQASAYFSPELCTELENALIAYGESQLGCRAITPVWMSYYVDGMMQELHCDNPQGPFAYVLSLTDWGARAFRGGETVIAKPRLLDYWSTHNPNEGLEHDALFSLIPPEFGRLTIFDPRFPHGVREVHGTRDPREGRLVLHGWFTAPEPFFTGGLSAEQAAPVIDEALVGAIQTLQEGMEGGGEEEGGEFEEEAPLGIHVTGVWVLQIHIEGGSGEVSRIDVLADTLVCLPSSPAPAPITRAMVQNEVAVWLEDAKFPRSADGSNSTITLPVVFE